MAISVNRHPHRGQSRRQPRSQPGRPGHPAAPHPNPQRDPSHIAERTRSHARTPRDRYLWHRRLTDGGEFAGCLVLRGHRGPLVARPRSRAM